MTISYNKLWKLMIDKNLNKGDVCNKTGISSSTMAKMTNGEPVTLQVLEIICRELKCNLDNVMEFKFDAEDNSQNENEK